MLKHGLDGLLQNISLLAIVDLLFPSSQFHRGLGIGVGRFGKIRICADLTTQLMVFLTSGFVSDIALTSPISWLCLSGE